MIIENSFLSTCDYENVVRHAPLFAIDIVVLNEFDEILLGKRLNAPAKNWLFVPGGRVFKNESLIMAFNRISNAELGISLEIEQAGLLGLYEHFYNAFLVMLSLRIILTQLMLFECQDMVFISQISSIVTTNGS